MVAPAAVSTVSWRNPRPVSHQTTSTAAPETVGPARRALHIRFDTIDQFGKLTLRRAGKLHHLGTGKTNAKKPVIILVDDAAVTVVDRATGEILSEHTIDPTRNYWRNNQGSPGRWPGLPL